MADRIVGYAMEEGNQGIAGVLPPSSDQPVAILELNGHKGFWNEGMLSKSFDEARERHDPQAAMFNQALEGLQEAAASNALGKPIRSVQEYAADGGSKT